jgi:hypothetical protein
MDNVELSLSLSLCDRVFIGLLGHLWKAAGFLNIAAFFAGCLLEMTSGPLPMNELLNSLAQADPAIPCKRWTEIACFDSSSDCLSIMFLSREILCC